MIESLGFVMGPCIVVFVELLIEAPTICLVSWFELVMHGHKKKYNLVKQC